MRASADSFCGEDGDGALEKVRCGQNGVRIYGADYSMVGVARQLAAQDFLRDFAQE